MNEKIKLTPEQRLIVQQEFQGRRKSGGVLLLLWLLCGGFGGHRFYLGHYKLGLLHLLTFGGLGFGLAIDLFAMWFSLKRHNEMLNDRITERMVTFANASADVKLSVPVA